MVMQIIERGYCSVLSYFNLSVILCCTNNYILWEVSQAHSFVSFRLSNQMKTLSRFTFQPSCPAIRSSTTTVRKSAFKLNFLFTAAGSQGSKHDRIVNFELWSILRPMVRQSNWFLTRRKVRYIDSVGLEI